MQPYTHALVGVATGISFFPDNHFAQATCVVGSITPDVISALQLFTDKLQRRKAFSEETKRRIFLRNISHSFWLLLGVIVAGVLTGNDIVIAFCAGTGSHLIIDMLTHKEKEYQSTDQKFFWPLNANLPGVLEYRYGQGIFRPKPFELVVCLLLIFYIGYCVYSHLAVYLARCVFYLTRKYCEIKISGCLAVLFW